MAVVQVTPEGQALSVVPLRVTVPAATVVLTPAKVCTSVPAKPLTANSDALQKFTVTAIDCALPRLTLVLQLLATVIAGEAAFEGQVAELVWLAHTPPPLGGQVRSPPEVMAAATVALSSTPPLLVLSNVPKSALVKFAGLLWHAVPVGQRIHPPGARPLGRKLLRSYVRTNPDPDPAGVMVDAVTDESNVSVTVTFHSVDEPVLCTSPPKA